MTTIPPAAGDLADATSALHAVVARLEHAQQHELVEQFVALFADAATWVTAGGRRLIGRPEIAQFTAAVLPGAMRESTAKYEVEHIVFVRPDVAVVAVRQRPVSLDGRPLAAQPEGRPTYVMAKDGNGEWRIVAGQNTQVPVSVTDADAGSSKRYPNTAEGDRPLRTRQELS
jgi:uncharacterized protein (TIGR02246 family)